MKIKCENMNRPIRKQFTENERLSYNERLDKINEQDKKIEQLEKEKDQWKAQILQLELSNLSLQSRLDPLERQEVEQNKEIKQLEKEKEWLINKLIRLDYPRTIPEIHKYPPVSEGHWRFIINEMQQALKEKEE